MTDCWWHSLKQLVDQIQLSEFDNDSYSVRIQHQTLLLGAEQALLIQCAQQATSAEQLQQNLSEHISGLTTELLQQISQILIEKINTLIDSPEHIYTSMNVPLYKLGWINHLAWKCRGIMKPTIFYKWFPATIFMLIISFIMTLDKWENVSLDLSTVGAFYLVLILSGLIHETGHMIAAQAIERKNVQVSFGFYLFIPVLYSDLSHIWSASREKRVVANLAGVAVETIFSLLLISIHIISGEVIWLHLALLISWSGLSNMLPFGRSDGYWILCDLFKQPNLLPRFIPSLLDWHQGKKQSKGERFPALYGLFNLTFMLVLFTAIISEMHSLMLSFPQRVWVFIRDFFQSNQVVPLTIEDLWLLGLWFFCFRILYMLSRFVKALRSGKSAVDSTLLG
ncbi:hypothetical protein [Pelagibaculum spongiae]|uniref:Peptidase M50 domain-containing protein n=1 Tax=Pelagibaculum spongiae TaxID=2080658 RepID=A0A2V1GYG3_9GAMM|nr:hypothetical protein [Pelagibaculum spongiae]PVZ70377.1 hypothetical protein DC094_07220 [Pelagibaculum spongiae]